MKAVISEPEAVATGPGIQLWTKGFLLAKSLIAS